MTRLATIVLGALPLLLASAALAQTPQPQVGGTVTAPQGVPGEAAPANNGLHVLFSIGNEPVAVWAPVAPPYDPLANGTGAADPMWPGMSLWSGQQ